MIKTEQSNGRFTRSNFLDPIIFLAMFQLMEMFIRITNLFEFE